MGLFYLGQPSSAHGQACWLKLSVIAGFKHCLKKSVVNLNAATAALLFLQVCGAANGATAQSTTSKDSVSKQKEVQLIYTSSNQNATASSTDVIYNADIIKSPVVSFRNALTGRLAGLYTIQSSGLPGEDGASLLLRGQTPVIIIDGVVTNLTTFDLEEIESVTVLKDALSTAMLGVRGSKGAILVTTKKGKEKKQQISFTVQTAIQKPVGFAKTLNAYNYALLHNEALRNEGIDSAYSGLYYSGSALDAYASNANPQLYPDNNYRSAVTTKSSTLNRYTLSATGGNKFAGYFVSLEHLNQTGFFKTVDSNRYNTNNNIKSYVIRSNVDVNINSKLTGGIYLLGRILNSNEPGATTNAILTNLFNTPANAYPIINANGSFGGNQFNQDNILAQTINSGYRENYKRDVLVNMYLKQGLDALTPGLWLQVKAAFYSTLAEDINRSKSFAVFDNTGSSSIQYGINGTQANGNAIEYQGRTDYQEFTIGYDRQFNEHGLHAIVLANRDNATNGADLPLTITGTSGRFSYDYKGKYSIETAFGLNGANRFPNEGKTKLGFFPSIGFGWNIDQENFMKSAPAISGLRLYASYGLTGWDNSGYFVYYPRFVDGPSAIFGTGAGGNTSISEGTLPYPGITWEKASKLNIGTRASFFSDKLSFSVEYYNNKYYDLLMQRARNSGLLGNDYPNENIGKNRYSGWETQIGWQQKIKQVEFFIAANGSTVKSKLLFMDEISLPYSWMKRTGLPVGQRIGYIAKGLYQSQSEINNSASTVGYTPQPGDIKYIDLNGDAVIDDKDQKAIGNQDPLFFYGVSFGLSWNGFDVSGLLQGVANRDIYLSGASYWAFQNNGTGQAYNHNLNRWTPANAATATYPRLSYGTNLHNEAVSSYWIKNGSYFRLRNAEIGYSLPLSLTSKIRLQHLRVFVNGYNLFTKASSSLDGRDPEVSSSSYPLQKLYNFGINIKF